MPCFGDTATNPAENNVCNFAMWHSDVLLNNTAAIGGFTIEPGLSGHRMAGCYLKRSVVVSQELVVISDFGSMIHNIFDFAAGSAKSIITNDQGYHGPDATDDRLSFYFGKNIIIAANTLNGNIFDDTFDTSSIPMIHGANSVYDNIFPLTNSDDYDVNQTTYTTVANLNASAFATGNAEVDITLDANGRPNEDVSAYGRDSGYFFDYFLKPLTSGDTWAGMAQSAQILTRMRIRT